MASEYYYKRGEREFGPVGGQQLKELARRGQIAPQDRVRRSNSSTSVAASSVGGLFAEKIGGHALTPRPQDPNASFRQSDLHPEPPLPPPLDTGLDGDTALRPCWTPAVEMAESCRTGSALDPTGHQRSDAAIGGLWPRCLAIHGGRARSATREGAARSQDGRQ